MSALRALKKLRAGAGQDMDDTERDSLVDELTKARDKLKKGKLAKSEMIVKSCRQAGLHTLPESNGILEGILAKGSQNMVRTVAYDPVSKQLKTCVNKDTYDAARQFLDKGGIEAFQSASGDLMSVLYDFNKAWGETEKLIQPYVVGDLYKEAEPLKDANGQTIKVKGAGKPAAVAINTCEASASEQECYARRTSMAGKAGDACVWMPNFAHLQDQILASGIEAQDLKELQDDVCVHRRRIPLPMRDATKVDETALRSGRQLKPDPKRGMGSSGRMVNLTAKAYEKATPLPQTTGTGRTSALPGVFQLRYPQFSITTPFGHTKQMPYMYQYKAHNPGKAVPVEVSSAAANAEKRVGASVTMQSTFRNFRAKLSGRMPQRIRDKLSKISKQNAEIKERLSAEIAHRNPTMDITSYNKAVAAALVDDPKYVSTDDQNDYVVYQLAKAGKLTQEDVNALAGQKAGKTIQVVTSDASVANAWDGLFTEANTTLSQKERAALKAALVNNTTEKGVNKDETFNKTTEGNTSAVYLGDESSGLDTLKNFLTAGGDTSGNMLPIPMPPRNSAASKRMFVTVNHGPMDIFGAQPSLQGGGLMGSSPKLTRSGEDPSLGDKFKKVKAVKVVKPAAASGNKNNLPGAGHLFTLNRYAILLLKANMKTYAPMLHAFYDKKAQTIEQSTNANNDVGNIDDVTAQWMRVFGALAGGAQNDAIVDRDDFDKSKAAIAAHMKSANQGARSGYILNSVPWVARDKMDTMRDAAASSPTTMGEDKAKAGVWSRKAGDAGYTRPKYVFPPALATRKILRALSEQKSRKFKGCSLLAHVFGREDFTKFASAESVNFLTWVDAKSSKELVYMCLNTQGGKVPYTTANKATADRFPTLVKAVTADPFTIEAFTNAIVLNGMTEPDDYTAPKSGAAINPDSPSGTDTAVAYAQWAAYAEKDSLRDLRDIANILKERIVTTSAVSRHKFEALRFTPGLPTVALVDRIA